MAKPWFLALHLPGAGQVKHLHRIFSSLSWWTLQSQKNLPVKQESDPDLFVSVSSSSEAGLVAYLPVERPIDIPRKGIWSDAGVWWNPATGQRHVAEYTTVSRKLITFVPPDEGGLDTPFTA